MCLYKNSTFFALSLIYIYAVMSSDGANVTISDAADKLKLIPTLDPAVVIDSPVFKPGLDSLSSLSLLSSFPEDLEISEYCSELLHIFGQRYVAYVNCLVPAARPVKVCLNCFSSYSSLMATYTNISSDQMGPGNVSCRDSLLRSDRLMVVYLLYNNLVDLWSKSKCQNCITEGFQSLTNDTLNFMSTLNQTLTCFEKYQQGNHTELCKNCKDKYRGLNELYSRLEKNHMCIDIEDAMNMTRKLWSKKFNCSFPREETVPVIAVSSFMLFLPIIFYLSSFLHSEQKKRKLIHQEDTCVGVIQEFNEDLCESQPEEKEMEESKQLTTPQRIINLQRDLTTLVTNIQTAADAKESTRRKELEEARRIRLERLENDVKSSQEKFEKISRGWLMAKQKVIPQELQEALNSQQQLCAEIIDDKKKLINDLQQELKGEDDRYVKDLRRQAEELDVMMERMEEQIKTLTQAYREEVALIESVYQQEREVLHTRHKTDWDQYMEDLRDKQQVRLTEKKKKVEEYETKIYDLMMETIDKFCILNLEENAKFQILEREHQQIKAKNMITAFEQMKQKNDTEVHNFNLSHMKSRIVSLQTKMKNVMSKYTSQEKQFKKKNWYLSEEYKRNIQQYEGIQKKISHFAVADAKKFEEMWLMIEAEVKQLVEGALVIDSLIYKQHLGLAWERPHMPFMELSGPLQPQKQAQRHTRQAFSQLFQSGKAVQCSHGMMDASVGPRLATDAESMDMEVCRQGTAVESAAEEEGKVSMETMKKLMELLCDESGFLMEDKVLTLLAPLEKDEQTVVKLSSLLCAFGIDEVDVPKLADFLLKYKQRQREPTEDVCAESGESTSSTTDLTSRSVHPNHVLPALKSFLKQHMHYRESSARQQPSFQYVEVRDTSEDEAYWESMGNVVSEDKVRLWEALENILKQHL
ncbi:hypothetical protein PAMP_014100 [Pampus punctatissimus]